MNWNLNGGPWKKARVLSSLAVAIRKGRSALKSTELIGLLWPMISPTEVPVSAVKTWPNLQHSQTSLAELRRGTPALNISNDYLNMFLFKWGCSTLWIFCLVALVGLVNNVTNQLASFSEETSFSYISVQLQWTGVLDFDTNGFTIVNHNTYIAPYVANISEAQHKRILIVTKYAWQLFNRPIRQTRSNLPYETF